MRRFIFFLYPAFCLLFGGCVVIPHHYYLPVSNTGEPQKTVCGEYGPPDSMLFESDGVWIRIWLQPMQYKNPTDFKIDLPSSYKLGEDYLVLGISIVGAPESVVVVMDREISMRVHPAESKKYVFNSFYRTENVAEQSGSETPRYEKRVYTEIDVGERLVFAPRARHFDTVYWGNVWLEAHSSDAVELERMDFEVNGRPFAIEHVNFIRKIGVYYYPIVGC